MRRPQFHFLILAILAVASPLHAYTIYLKDGSRLIAREKYRVEEGKAIIVLQNGTQTFIDASEVDLDRTEQANRGKYGTALKLEEGRLTELPATPPRPQKQTTLTDLAARGQAARTRPPARRESPEQLSRARARMADGYVDLATLERKPYRNIEISAEIQRVFRANGVEELHIFQGSRRDNTFLEITTNSEASVFRSLEAAAEALVHLGDQYSGTVESFELLLSTSSHNKAGQFVMTPELAAELAEKRIEVSAFFVHNVQF